MTFYTPDGAKSISKDEFIRIYSDDYYLNEPGSGIVYGLSRCSIFIENKMKSILCDGIKDERDVVRILAWKIGKIKHRESENAKEFKYASDWQNAEQLKHVKLYGKSFDIKKVVSYIVDNIDMLENLAKNDPQIFLNKINEQNFDRIGTVYMLTLLYYMSRGEYPIYDRFAMMALNAIEEDIQPSSNPKEKVDVPYMVLPNKKNQKYFSSVMSIGMKEFIDKLTDIFGNAYRYDRRIDQALWVYGHRFKQK